MIDNIIKNICEHAKHKRLFFTEHAILRMNQREIRDTQVYDCIVHGKFVEKQFHGKQIKIIFQPNTEGIPPYYVVVANTSTYPLVITVCLTYAEVWEYMDGLLKRKGE